VGGGGTQVPPIQQTLSQPGKFSPDPPSQIHPAEQQVPESEQVGMGGLGSGSGSGGTSPSVNNKTSWFPIPTFILIHPAPEK